MSKDFEDLPYGIWHCKDGSVYLFNRFYKPFYCRSPDGVLTEPDRSAWIDWTSETYFYDGSTDPSIIERVRFIRDSFIKGGALNSVAAKVSMATDEMEAGL